MVAFQAVLNGGFAMDQPGSGAAVEIAVRAIDHEAFAPFGTLAAASDNIARLQVPTRFDEEVTRGEATLSLIRVQALRLGCAARPTLERHPFSVQAFIPLGDAPLVAVVAARELDRPAAADLRAFRARPRQAIIYREGTWHLGMACDGAPMVVAVFIRRLEDGSDTEMHELDCDLRLIRGFA